MMNGTPLWVEIPFAIFLVVVSAVFVILGIAVWRDR